jgi:CelD/BcsL family acetyltransferase involved in cellulose biosynthesis
VTDEAREAARLLSTEDVREAFIDAGLRTMNADAALIAFDRWLATVRTEARRQALEYARVRPEFDEYMPNDGEHEYTSSSDCDGSNVKHWRRLPRYVGEHHPWEQVSREQFADAIDEGNRG